jgi:hypothetical protein
MGEQTIELSQHLLGMRPYVLIEADVNPADGELVLKIKVGGGASEQVGALPFMMITTLAADQNPLTMAIGEYLAEFPEHRDALANFAETLGVPMPDASEVDRG